MRIVFQGEHPADFPHALPGDWHSPYHAKVISLGVYESM